MDTDCHGHGPTEIKVLLVHDVGWVPDVRPGEVVVDSGSGISVVDVLNEAWDAIGALGDVLGPTEWDLPSECPGWTVRDVLSHMVGTERSLLGEPDPTPVRDFPPHVHNAVGARNEAWVLVGRSSSGPDVLADFRRVTRRRLAQMRSWPSSRFDELTSSPVGEVPYGEFMRVRVMDCWVHEQDIRVATGRPGHRDGPAADLALDRLTAAMPFVVGKSAQAPEGSMVRFDLTGSSPRRFDVKVTGGRASVVEAPAAGPTVELRMDLEVFWRLGCGRVTGAAARGAGLVELRGDEGLGQRVVDSMSFMI
jgi:uncharacterized protein (TIGR03083 family)